VSAKTVILGLGNQLRRDEGIGVHVAQAMEHWDLPPGVQVIDGGTSALDVLLCLESQTRLVIVDAVVGGCEPGTVYRLRTADLGSEGVCQRPLSLHELGPLEALALAGDRFSEVVIIGVEPKELGWGLELSPELAAKVPELAKLALQEIH
jgi:hydrogenase maturation protease